VSLAQGAGVDGRSLLFLWKVLDIVALLSPVALEEFSGPAAEQKMPDLTWMASRALRHKEIVERAMCHSPVLPARFGTIFSSLEKLEMLIKEQHDAISAFLARIADKEEWAVKGLLDRPRARNEMVSTKLVEQEATLSSVTVGIRYFQEQRIRINAEKKLNGWLRETCDALAAELCTHASDFSERQLISCGDSRNGLDKILDWAFWVPRHATADFRAQIDEANAKNERYGLVLGLSGPWPPYSFCPSLEPAS
jgi:hypothetical protein